jgi:hypothetical protein
MLNPQLLDYVKQQIAQGLSKETIQNNLLSQGGWHLNDINEAFTTLGVNAVSNMPIAPDSTQPSVLQQNFKRKVKADWYIAITHWLTSSIMTFVLSLILILILSVLIPLFFRSLNISALHNIFVIFYMIVYPTAMWFAVKYSAKYLNKTYVIKDANNIIKLSTIFIIILGIGVRIGTIISAKTVNFEDFAFVLAIISFYFASKKYVKENTIQALNKDLIQKNNKAVFIVAIIAIILIVLFGTMKAITNNSLNTLNTARLQGTDAAIKQSLVVMQPEAELYYDGNNNSYSGVCTAPGGQYGLSDMITSVLTSTGSSVSCFASQKVWVASAPLKSNPQISYCVDSSGYVGNGIADENSFSCNVNISTNVISTSTLNIPAQNIIRSNYTYSLPAGWQSEPISANHIEAMQDTTTNHSALTIATTTVQAVLLKGVSEQNFTQKFINDFLSSEFPNSTILGTQYGLIGGEKAFISKVNLKTTNSKGSTVQLFTMQYLTFHNNLSYIVVLATSYPQDDAVLSDFQSIVNSFKFIDNPNASNINSVVNTTSVKTSQPTKIVQTTQSTDPIIINTQIAGQNISINKAFALDFSTPSNNTYYYDYYLIPGNLPPISQQASGTYFDKSVGGYDIGGIHLNIPTSHYIVSPIIPGDIAPGQYKLRIYQFDYQYISGGTNTVSTALAFKDSGYFNVTN